MMKHVFWSSATIVAIAAANWLIAAFLGGAVMDYAFLTGLAAATTVGFFNSSGGFASDAIRLSAQAQTGIKVEKDKQTFRPTVVFYTAVVYTIVALIATIIYYKDYFL